MGAFEIANNTSGRVANKGMEGLAITPDGRTLVGIMQNALIQDAASVDGSLTRGRRRRLPHRADRVTTGAPGRRHRGFPSLRWEFE